MNPFAAPEVARTSASEGRTVEHHLLVRTLAWLEISVGSLLAFAGCAGALFLHNRSHRYYNYSHPKLVMLGPGGLIVGALLIISGLLLRTQWRWRWWLQLLPALYVLYSIASELT